MATTTIAAMRASYRKQNTHEHYEELQQQQDEDVPRPSPPPTPNADDKTDAYHHPANDADPRCGTENEYGRLTKTDTGKGTNVY
jgi:hypothetical protein